MIIQSKNIYLRSQDIMSYEDGANTPPMDDGFDDVRLLLSSEPRVYAHAHSSAQISTEHIR